jgi:urease accessory protein
VIGNIRGSLKARYEEMAAKNAVERIVITRLESERTRMRKSTDRGTDVALTLPQRTRLRHGDVIELSGSRMIIIEIEPEKVAAVRIGNDARLATLIGHAIGNLHRPVKVGEDRVYFPIQSEDEVLMIRRQLAPLGNVEVTTDIIVFEPEAAVHHEH